MDLLPVEQGVVRALDVAHAEGLSCIVCPVDYVALDLLRAAASRGVSVPEEVSVVGYDGLGDGLDLIGLATVRLPVTEVARASVDRMQELLVRAQESPEGPPPSTRVEPPAVRHSLHVGQFLPGRTLGTVPEHLRD